MADLLKQSSTAQPLVFLMLDSADHISAKTGLSPTVTLSKAGGSFASPSGAVTEIANGWYKVAGNATDTNTLGPLILHATSAGADPSDVEYAVVAFDPQSATAFITGINSLAPPAAWNTDVVQSGDAYARLGAAGVGLTNLGDARIANLDTTVSSRSTFAGGAVASVTGAVGSVTGNVGGNVTGSVGSVTGAVGSVTGAVGSVTSAVSTNPNAVENAIKAKTDNLPIAPAEVGSVMSLDLTQAIPTTNTAQTIGDAMNAARAQGFGRWKLVGNTLSLYGADGLTVVKTLTFDDTNSPSERK